MTFSLSFVLFRDFTDFVTKFIKVGCLTLNNTTNENEKILNDTESIITILYTKFGNVRVHFDSFVVPKTQKSILIPSFSIYYIICPVAFIIYYNTSVCNRNFNMRFLKKRLNIPNVQPFLIPNLPNPKSMVNFKG